MADTAASATTVDGEDFLVRSTERWRKVYISERQGRHDVRVKVAAGVREPPFVASVSVRPDIRIVAGDLTASDFELVRQWIELNRDVIIGYWDRTIEDTADALNALQPLPTV